VELGGSYDFHRLGILDPEDIAIIEAEVDRIGLHMVHGSEFVLSDQPTMGDGTELWNTSQVAALQFFSKKRGDPPSHGHELQALAWSDDIIAGIYGADEQLLDFSDAYYESIEKCPLSLWLHAVERIGISGLSCAVSFFDGAIGELVDIPATQGRKEIEKLFVKSWDTLPNSLYCLRAC
jgi:hypothetical protein